MSWITQTFELLQLKKGMVLLYLLNTVILILFSYVFMVWMIFCIRSV